MNITQKDREQLVTEWRESGLTKVEFCKQRTISLNSINAWIKKINREKKTTSNFIKVHMPVLPAVTTHYCELHYPTGVKLIFNQAPDYKLMKHLL